MIYQELCLFAECTIEKARDCISILACKLVLYMMLMANPVGNGNLSLYLGCCLVVLHKPIVLHTFDALLSPRIASDGLPDSVLGVDVPPSGNIHGRKATPKIEFRETISLPHNDTGMSNAWRFFGKALT